MAVAEVAVRTTQRRGETRASITHTSLSPDAYLLPPSRTLIARCLTLEAMAQHSELLPVPKPLSTPSSVDDLDILCTLSYHTRERTRKSQSLVRVPSTSLLATTSCVEMLALRSLSWKS